MIGALWWWLAHIKTSKKNYDKVILNKKRIILINCYSLITSWFYTIYSLKDEKNDLTINYNNYYYTTKGASLISY